MANQDYLIAIALIEQNEARAMPLGGKEIKEKLEENLNKLGEEVVFTNPLILLISNCYNHYIGQGYPGEQNFQEDNYKFEIFSLLKNL